MNKQRRVFTAMHCPLPLYIHPLPKHILHALKVLLPPHDPRLLGLHILLPNLLPPLRSLNPAHLMDTHAPNIAQEIQHQRSLLPLALPLRDHSLKDPIHLGDPLFHARHAQDKRARRLLIQPYDLRDQARKVLLDVDEVGLVQGCNGRSQDVE